MDFQDLTAFRTLSAHLHFARAAGVLQTSPSSLSRRVREMEKEMGSPLLERDTRGVALTEAGRVFLAFAEETLQRRHEMGLALGQAGTRFQGTLRLYASVTACYSILPPLVRALRRHQSGLVLSVVTGDPADARFALAEGRVDLALSALPRGGQPGFEAFRVERTPLVFVVARDGKYGKVFRGSQKRQFQPEQILGHPMILPARGLSRERFDRWLKKHRQRLRLAAETSGNEAVLALTRLGLGVGFVPRLVLDNSPFARGLTTFAAGGELGDYEIGFLMPSHRTGGMGPDLKAALKVLMEKAYPKGQWVERGTLSRDAQGNPFLEP